MHFNKARETRQTDTHNMEMNEQTQLAWNIIETTNTNLFLTGKAGTGKTTFLRRLKTESSKRIIVVAPTGIAAINAEGTTIHSFFQLSFAPFIPDAQYKTKEQQYRFSKQKIRVIQSIDTLVIDEISMVRADLLDAVDAVLRRFRKNNLPFGGVQMVMIGDLGQLAPVAKDDEWQLLSRYYATPYFFSSLALQRTRYAIVELKTVYRQNDQRFLDILNKVRDNHADASVLAALNSRYIQGFQPDADEGYIRLGVYEQLIIVKDQQECWGYADLSGNVVCPCIWDSVSPFFNGWALVESEKKAFYIDHSMHIVFTFEECDTLLH